MLCFCDFYILLPNTVMAICELPEEVRCVIRSGISIASTSQCVSELVLNSIDADATSVNIHIDLKYFIMKVIDNGCGIPLEELDKVGCRYMTSKCHSLKDLQHNLKYFGFRGEALASLSELSGVLVIETRPSGSSETYCKLFTHGKKHPAVVSTVKRPSYGTTVSVSDFMYNMRVRRNRIHESMDLEEIKHEIECVALMHPKVSFILQNDANRSVVLQTKKHSDTIHVFSNLFGEQLTKCLKPVSFEFGKFKISGYIGIESHSQKNRQFIYVNKRLVLKTKFHKLVNAMLAKSSILRCNGPWQDAPISKAATARRFLAFPAPDKRDRFAVFVLNIECAYNEYDICMEPKKSLIEFRDWDSVLHCMEQAIRIFLETQSLTSVDSGITNAHKCDMSVIQEMEELAKESALNYKNVVNVNKDVHFDVMNNAKGVLYGLAAKRKNETHNKININDHNKKNCSSIPLDLKDGRNCVTNISTAHNCSEDPLDSERLSKGNSQKETLKISSSNRLLSNSAAASAKRSMLKQMSELKKHNAAKKLQNFAFNQESKLKLFHSSSQNKSVQETNHKTNTAVSVDSNLFEKNSRSLSRNVSQSKSSFAVQVGSPLGHNSVGTCTNLDGTVDKYPERILDDCVKNVNSEATLDVSCQTQPFEITSEKVTVTDHKCSAEDISVSAGSGVNRKDNCTELISKRNHPLKHVHFQLHSGMSSSSSNSGSLVEYSNSKRSCTLRRKLLPFSNMIPQKKYKKIEDISQMTADSSTSVTEQCNDNFYQKESNLDSAVEDNYGTKNRDILNEKSPNLGFCQEKYSNYFSFSSSESNYTYFNVNQSVSTCTNVLESQNAILSASNNVSNSSPQRGSETISCNVEKCQHHVNPEFDCSNKVLENEASKEINSPELLHSIQDVVESELILDTQRCEFDIRGVDSPDSFKTSQSEQPCISEISKLQDSQDIVNSECSRNESTSDTFGKNSKSRNCKADLPLSLPETTTIKMCLNGISKEFSPPALHQINFGKFKNLNNARGNSKYFPSISKSSVTKQPGDVNRKEILTFNSFPILRTINKCKGKEHMHDKPKESSSVEYVSSVHINSINSSETTTKSEKLQNSSSQYFCDSVSTQELSEVFDTVMSNIVDLRTPFQSLKSPSEKSNVSEKSNANSASCSSGFDNNLTGTEQVWMTSFDSNGRAFYIHIRSGITSYEPPVPSREQIAFSISERCEFLPKGMSPLMNAANTNLPELNPEAQELINNVVANESLNQCDEDFAVKWRNGISATKTGCEEVITQIFNNINGRMRFCEPQIPNAEIEDNFTIQINNFISPHTFTKDVFSHMKIIGQLDKKFIVAIISANNDSKNRFILLLFDQHAVHERIRLETLTKDYCIDAECSKFKFTDLNEKVLLQIDAQQARIMSSFHEEFSRIGLHFHTVNDMEIEVTKVPTCLHNRMLREGTKGQSVLKKHLESLIREHVDVLLNTRGVGPRIPNTLHNVISSEACRGAVKFGDDLSVNESKALLKNLALCDVPFQCAHGRPALVPIVDLSAIQKQVKVSRRLRLHGLNASKR